MRISVISPPSWVSGNIAVLKAARNVGAVVLLMRMSGLFGVPQKRSSNAGLNGRSKRSVAELGLYLPTPAVLERVSFMADSSVLMVGSFDGINCLLRAHFGF